MLIGQTNHVTALNKNIHIASRYNFILGSGTAPREVSVQSRANDSTSRFSDAATTV